MGQVTQGQVHHENPSQPPVIVVVIPIPVKALGGCENSTGCQADLSSNILSDQKPNESINTAP